MRPLATGLLACILSLAAMGGTAQAQADPPPTIPVLVEDAAAEALAAERQALVAQLSAVQSHIAAHDSQCSRIRSDDNAALQACRASQQAVLAEIAAYRAALAAYEDHLRAAPRVIERTYRHAGNGLVGGTGWQLGYYSPVGASAEVQARARQMVREQAEAAVRANPGATRYDERIDFDRYSFAIGIANVPWFSLDFVDRVFWDQLTNGRATPVLQQAYNSLRGRSFDELACHSNGAMICLAALHNRDIQAGDVVLYGPQITVSSMLEWNRLLARGQISSLRIVVAQNDPVTPASLLYSISRYPTGDSAAAAASPVFFDVGRLASTLQRMSPQAVVNTFPCGGPFYTGLSEPFDCHNLARYSAFSRPCPQPANPATVPGTRNPGASGRRVEEPPPPCYGPAGRRMTVDGGGAAA